MALFFLPVMYAVVPDSDSRPLLIRHTRANVLVVYK